MGSLTPRQYCFVAVSVALAVLAAIAIFNILVDPLGAYLPFSLRSFAPLRITLFSRAARAELARHHTWDMVILGTSRPKSGFPPQHEGYGTNRVCNLGLDGSVMSEASLLFEYVRARQPLKKVVLFLDFSMFRHLAAMPQDFADSRLSPQFSVLAYHCRNLLGADATGRSWEYVSLLRHHQWPPPGETNGFYVHQLRARTTQHELFERVIRSHAAMYAAIRVDAEEMERLRHVIRTCRTNGISLVLGVNPVHALDLELLRAAGNWDGYESWKRSLVDLIAAENAAADVPLWDFSGYSGPPTEHIPPPGSTNRMKFYFENSHYTRAVGALMLDRMVGRGESAFGTLVSTTNIESHLEQIRHDRAIYTSAHPRDVEWVQRLAAEGIQEERRHPGLQDVE